MTETSAIKNCIDKEETACLKKLITKKTNNQHYIWIVASECQSLWISGFIEGRKLEIDNFECIKKTNR